MKAEIIRLLKEHNAYLSGQELSERLHVSRTAIWKVMKQLQEEGYEIEAIRNKGYRLVESADVLTEAELESCMRNQMMGGHVKFLRLRILQTQKRNGWQKKALWKGLWQWRSIKQQEKGRRGKSWTSPSGSGIWMSLLLRPKLEPSCAPMITLLTGLAVSMGIEDYCKIQTQIKWPNDLTLSGKKICGILTEMSADVELIHYVVIGIGINVNTPKFPEEIEKIATSLYLESGRRLKRSGMIACIMKRMEEYYKLFLETSDLSGIQKLYEERLVNRDREVLVLAPKGEYKGICRGIDKDGELLVELEDGTISHVMSEVSVRGIYGYV